MDQDSHRHTECGGGGRERVRERVLHEGLRGPQLSAKWLYLGKNGLVIQAKCFCQFKLIYIML